jgi:hypothetical protein
MLLCAFRATGLFQIIRRDQVCRRRSFEVEICCKRVGEFVENSRTRQTPRRTDVCERFYLGALHEGFHMSLLGLDLTSLNIVQNGEFFGCF